MLTTKSFTIFTKQPEVWGFGRRKTKLKEKNLQAFGDCIDGLFNGGNSVIDELCYCRRIFELHLLQQLPHLQLHWLHNRIRIHASLPLPGVSAQWFQRLKPSAEVETVLGLSQRPPTKQSLPLLVVATVSGPLSTGLGRYSPSP